MTTDGRYDQMFAARAAEGRGAFVPFVVLGDPTPAQSLEIIAALVAGGADALELGIPFSDPIADGPTIQAADVRALSAGTTLVDVFRVLTEVLGIGPHGRLNAESMFDQRRVVGVFVEQRPGVFAGRGVGHGGLREEGYSMLDKNIASSRQPKDHTDRHRFHRTIARRNRR